MAITKEAGLGTEAEEEQIITKMIEEAVKITGLGGRGATIQQMMKVKETMGKVFRGEVDTKARNIVISCRTPTIPTFTGNQKMTIRRKMTAFLTSIESDMSTEEEEVEATEVVSKEAEQIEEEIQTDLKPEEGEEEQRMQLIVRQVKTSEMKKRSEKCHHRISNSITNKRKETVKTTDTTKIKKIEKAMESSGKEWEVLTNTVTTNMMTMTEVSTTRKRRPPRLPNKTTDLLVLAKRRKNRSMTMEIQVKTLKKIKIDRNITA